jgi:hypothetical protein
MNQWQPISTAPRDGSRILYWSKHYQKPDIAYYRDGHLWMGTAVYEPSAIPREWEDVASHWMPLPEAPPDAVAVDPFKEYFDKQKRAIAGAANGTG